LFNFFKFILCYIQLGKVACRRTPPILEIWRHDLPKYYYIIKGLCHKYFNTMMDGTGRLSLRVVVRIPLIRLVWSIVAILVELHTGSYRSTLFVDRWFSSGMPWAGVVDQTVRSIVAMLKMSGARDRTGQFWWLVTDCWLGL